jgi:two-component system response regulator HydG
LLAQAFLNEFARQDGKAVNSFTAEALGTLLRYRWPGNVRELRTAVEHAVVLCRGDRVTARDLPAWVRGGVANAPAGGLAPGNTGLSGLTVKAAEKELIQQALKEAAGNRTAAARKLGMSRRTLHRKLHLYHLEGF